MDSVNNKPLLDHRDQSSSRKKRKITLIIFLIIIFTTIIVSILSVLTILKRQADSESPPLSAVTPDKAITAVCSLTPFPESCSSSLCSLQRTSEESSKITPSQIFALSLQVTYDELIILSSTSHKVISKVNASSRAFSALQECQSVILDSSMLINRSLTTIGSIPEDEIYKDSKRVRNLKVWIQIVKENLEKCLNGMEGTYDERERFIHYGYFYYLKRFKWEMLSARQYVENSYVILEKLGAILDMFYNPIPLQSVLANIMMSTAGFDFSVVFFPTQYLVLVYLFCLLLKLHRHVR